MRVRRVLLADDEEGVVALVEAALGGDGRYELVVARDGEEALAKAGEVVPEVVLLDVVMPKVDGYEVCRRLKARDGGVKVVLLTALAQEGDRARAWEAGADECLTKPFSPLALARKVRELLQLQE